MFRHTEPLLILAVTGVLLSLLLAGSQPWLVVLAVTIVLVSLILVIGGAAELLPAVLQVLFSEILWLLRLKHTGDDMTISRIHNLNTRPIYALQPPVDSERTDDIYRREFLSQRLNNELEPVARPSIIEGQVRLKSKQKV